MIISSNIIIDTHMGMGWSSKSPFTCSWLSWSATSWSRSSSPHTWASAGVPNREPSSLNSRQFSCLRNPLPHHPHQIIIITITTIIVIIIHTRSFSSSLIILIKITIRMMIRNQDHDDCLRDGVTRVGGGDKVAASALTSSPSPAVTRRRICHLEIVFLYVFVFSLGVKQYFWSQSKIRFAHCEGFIVWE